MLTTILAGTLFYSLQVQPLAYQVGVELNGFLPLFGGQDGKVNIDLTVKLAGNTGEKPGTLRVTHELTDASLKFNDAVLPVGLDNVKSYFPKATTTLDLLGNVLASDRPELKVPITLPGLDVKRVPELVYLPVVFSKSETVQNASWKFDRAYAGGPISYECKLANLTAEKATIDIKLSQKYTTYEDEDLNQVNSKAGAKIEVVTSMQGTGKAIFQLKTGAFESFEIKSISSGIATDLQTKKSTTRKLEAKYSSKQVTEKQKKPSTGGSWWSRASGYWQVARGEISRRVNAAGTQLGLWTAEILKTIFGSTRD